MFSRVIKYIPAAIKQIPAAIKERPRAAAAAVLLAFILAAVAILLRTGTNELPRPVASPSEPGSYLWAVYQRTRTKKDHTGIFSWKDRKAAERRGMSVEQYVIGGIDPAFRSELEALGRALDAGGLRWTILSGFRDDYRQSIASGFKARVGHSMHGGSRRTGEYGHGCAVDLAGVDRGDDAAIRRFIDRHPGFGIFRPMKAHDPDHVQPTSGCAGVRSIHRHHTRILLSKEP